MRSDPKCPTCGGTTTLGDLAKAVDVLVETAQRVNLPEIPFINIESPLAQSASVCANCGTVWRTSARADAQALREHAAKLKAKLFDAAPDESAENTGR